MTDMSGTPSDPGMDPTTVQPAADQPDGGQPDGGPPDGDSSSSRPPWLIPVLVVLAVVAAGLVFALVSSGGDSDCDGDDEAAVEVDLSAAEIRLIQQDLTDLGYYGCSVNGVYNTQTVDAVKELQTDLGLNADGIIGPETLAAIDELLARGSTTSSSTSSTAPADTTSTTAGSTPPPEGVPEVELTIDGGPTTTFEVTRCDNPSETTVTLTGETTGDDVTRLELEAEDGQGTLTLSGADEAEGTVDTARVSDTGAIVASGDIAPSDDSAETSSFRLEGQCA